jgi:hypothetical protein
VSWNFSFGHYNLKIVKVDQVVKSRKTPSFVIPVKTGIQEFQDVLDSRLSTLRSRATAEDGRGSDVPGGILRMHQS